MALGLGGEGWLHEEGEMLDLISFTLFTKNERKSSQVMRGIVSAVDGLKTVLMVSNRTFGLWQFLVIRSEKYLTLSVSTVS